MPFDHGYALLIGVGSYPNAPYKPVLTIERDVDELAAVLTDPRICGYPREQVNILKGAAATRTAVLAALTDLSKLPADATVTIYFTGHGERSADQSYHLVTHDARWLKNKVEAGTALREDELIGYLRAVKAERLLLIVNACSSGEISPVLGSGAAEDDLEESMLGTSLPEASAQAILATGKGRIIITASSERQVSFVGRGTLTPFAQALIGGLRGQGTYNRNGYISAFDLYEAVHEGVAALLPQLVGAAALQHYGPQEPELTVLKGRGSYAVALYNGAETQALGAFDQQQAPERPAVRAIDERKSQRALEALLSNVIEAQGEGIAQSGNQGPTSAQSGGGIGFGSSNTFGDISIGDVAGGDIVKNNYGSGTMIKPQGIFNQVTGEQRNINAQTYNEHRYEEGATHVGGDHITISNVSGGILNVKSKLDNVIQTIGEIKSGNQAQRDELNEAVAQLKQILEKVPASRAEDAEAVAAMTQLAVDEVQKKEKPNKMVMKTFADNIVAAAKNIADVADNVIGVATKVATAILAFL